MTDWTKTTGVNGKMMIRDTGSSVEFWFKAGYSSDWVNGLKFSWTANGSTTNKSINYPTGAAWYHVGSVTIHTTQTVTFKLVSDTSISGIGGPTTFSHSIKRATVPAKPSTPKLTNISSTTVYVTFTDGSNGGASINSRQIGYGTSSSSPQHTVSSDKTTTVTGLVPGTTYYFWARTHNSVGYSSWSGRASAVTLKVPDAPSKPVLSNVKATTIDVAFTANGNGGATIVAYQIGYGVDSSGPTSTVASDGSTTISGLNPGTVYYFWARAQNSVGWGPWSTAVSTRMIAGAYILVGTAWKLAVPYVKADGEWKLAEPWVRNVGVWKQTT